MGPSGKIHKLKCWRTYFREIRSGDKTFEIREDDRHYGVGDVLHLVEYDPDRDRYSGEEEWVRVTSIMTAGNAPVHRRDDEGKAKIPLHPDFVIMSIELCEPQI